MTSGQEFVKHNFFLKFPNTSNYSNWVLEKCVLNDVYGLQYLALTGKS